MKLKRHISYFYNALLEHRPVASSMVRSIKFIISLMSFTGLLCAQYWFWIHSRDHGVL